MTRRENRFQVNDYKTDCPTIALTYH